MTDPTETPRPRPARQLDLAIVRIRWLIALIVLLLGIFQSKTYIPELRLLGWVSFFVLYNFVNWFFAYRRILPPQYNQITLWIDTALFAALPFFSPNSGPLLFLLALFPATVAAIRFGQYTGAVVAGILTLPFEFRALWNLIPASVRPSSFLDEFLPLDPASVGLLPLMLFGAVFLIGYIGKRDRESTLGSAAVELEELRRAVSSAQIFYRTVDALSSTLNYSRVLEGMLDAGLKGLPNARREDGPGIAMALFFGDESPDKYLHVIAHRNLHRSDPGIRVPGREGIIAEVLRLGESLTFHDATADPELSLFSALRNCRAGVCYPLQAGLEQYGVVIIASPTPRLPGADQFEMMRAFVSQAAVAFQNTKLYGNLRAERDRIIDSDGRARTKLARDLHDGPIQKVSAASMNIEFIRKLIERDPEKAKTELEQMHRLLDTIIKEMRDLLFTLRPLSLEAEGLSAALRQLADRLNRNEGTRIEMDAGNFGSDLDEIIGGTVFSIIEEAINNARKHATGARIFVSVSENNSNLVALVRDEGPGFDVNSITANYEERGSLGLVNMHERAQLVDGKLTIESTPGRGTVVHLIVPLRLARSPE